MKNKKVMPNGRQGFTLIELLIVISIIGILAGIVIVSVTGAQRKARETSFKTTVSSLRPAITMCCDNITNTIDGTAGSDVCSDPVDAIKPASIENVAITYTTTGTCADGDVEIVATPASSIGNCTSGTVNVGGATFAGC